MMLRLCAAVLLNGALVHGHGFVQSPECRAHACRSNGGANKNCGAIQYEAQSVEGPDRYPDSNPPDGKLASGSATSRFPELDEQSADRWVKQKGSSGPIKITWNFQANHATLDFRYFITKNGWNPNAPLTRATFESEPFCTIERGGALPPKLDTHSCVVPPRSGYHIIYAIWDVSDTSNSFYNVIDMDFGGGGGGGNPMPPPPAPVPQPVAPPVYQPPPYRPQPVSPPVYQPPPPTPPASGGSCSNRISRWGGCLNNPSCCDSGLNCYAQSKWYAQCLKSTDHTAGYTMIGSGSGGSSPPPPAPTPPYSPPAYTPPYSPPAYTPPYSPPSGGCASTVSLWGGCKNSPNCCASGSTCKKYNPWYSQCVPSSSGGSPPAPVSPPYSPPTPPYRPPTPVYTPPTVYPPPASPPSSGPSGGSGNLVSLDFESESENTIPSGWGTFSGYVPNSGDAVKFVHVSSTKAHSGSKSLRVAGPSGGPAQIVKQLSGNPKNVYMRAYYWLSETMGNQPGDNHETLMGTKKYEGAGRPFSADSEIRIGQAKGHLGFNQVPTDAVSPPYAKWFTGPQIPKQKWVCVEGAILTDKPFDEIHMWVDNKLVNSATSSADWHSPMKSNWAQPLMGNVFFGWHSFSQRGMDLWIDDIEVSTSRIGC